MKYTRKTEFYVGDPVLNGGEVFYPLFFVQRYEGNGFFNLFPPMPQRNIVDYYKSKDGV